MHEDLARLIGRIARESSNTRGGEQATDCPTI